MFDIDWSLVLCGCFRFLVFVDRHRTWTILDCVRVQLLSFDTPNAEALHVSAQFAYAKTILCYDLAKAKKATDGKNMFDIDRSSFVCFVSQ